ncbi:MAG: helix-turn-helix transcriptional regulator [Saprospiraceae bacterium]|nr:helix-turn-helix transcriptional regulator [Saprospiraceae bacterium]
MSLMLGENIKYLRKRENLSQQQLAEILDTPRTTLGDYERGHTEPNLETLVRIARHFKLTIDNLLTEKLWHRELEVISQSDLKVLAITVDSHNRQNIEYVAAKAQAGYLENFQDPEFIQELPKLYFPSIPEGTYRAFEIQGDSMLPLPTGSIVICNYIEGIEELRNERTYVIATHLDGIVYKRILVNPDGSSLTAMSDNPVYPPYKIPYRDIAEIWQYYAHLSFSDNKAVRENALDQKISDIQETVNFLKKRMQ